MSWRQYSSLARGNKKRDGPILIPPTRQDAGCIRYELLQNQSDPKDFTFVEEWDSNDAINVHLDSAHIEAADTKLDGLVAAEPDIRRYSQLA